jgi:CHAD domain-containing protein
MKKPAAYLQQRKDKLTAVLQLPPQDYTPQTFHELRVEIKKLRTVIAFLQTVDSECCISQKQQHSLQIIFKSAGIIREKQLEIIFMENTKSAISHDAFALLCLNLFLAEEIEKAYFFALLNNDIAKTIRQLCDELESRAEKLPKAIIYHFLQRQHVQIRQRLQAHPTQKQLHSIRKQLKAHEYVLKSTGYQPPKWNAAQIAQLLDLLGAWQDCEAMMESFQQQIKATHASYIKDALRLLIRKLAARQQTITQQLSNINILKQKWFY